MFSKFSKNSFKLVLLLVTIALLTTGCPLGSGIEDEPEPPGPVGGEELLSQYYPLVQGATWRYAGFGNEFAAFNREVVEEEGTLAQVQEENAGATGVAIFNRETDRIVRIFWEGEQYGDDILINVEPNDDTVILQIPLEVGQSWENDNHTREIISLDVVVETPAGEFNDCLHLELSYPQSTVNEYYHQGVGLVKREFISQDGYVVSSELEEYSIP